MTNVPKTVAVIGAGIVGVSTTIWLQRDGHKVILIDDQIVITGSYNFSNNAKTRNDENTLIVHSPDIAAIYRQEFERVWGEAKVLPE